jgi:hypothetical protein
MTYTTHKHYHEFKKRFRTLSDDELLETYKNDKGKRVGITAHTEFIRALKEECEIRGYVYPRIVKKV